MNDYYIKKNKKAQYLDEKKGENHLFLIFSFNYFSIIFIYSVERSTSVPLR